MVYIEKLARVSWECVHFVPKSEVIPSAKEFEGRGIKAFEIRGEKVRSVDDLFSCIAAAMEFPDYFGNNWNALDECLRDLEWHDAKGYVLVVHDAEELWRRETRVMGTFLQSWLFSAEEWGRHDTPFHLIFVW